LGHVEATETVEAPREDVFHFTDWCYDDPKWARFINKAWIVKLPGADGLGMVSHYAGKVMGRKLEWEGELVKWKRSELWARKALSGPFARMRMQMEMRFETAGTGTKVTSRIDYKVPYPLAGWLIDKLYMRRQARKMANDAVEGIKKAAMEGRIQPLQVQLEKRKVDHPGYLKAS
jgi:uncharacterized membrane protein